MNEQKTPKYPEHEKLARVKSRSQTIGEFLDWLPTVGLHIGEYVRIEGFRGEWLMDTGQPIEKLLAKYFDIDLIKIEDEKREMLEELRVLNAGQVT